MARATGLEISPTLIRAVVADGSVKGWRVLSYAEAEIAPPAEGQDPKQVFAEQVAKFVAEKKLPRGILIPSIPAAVVTVREVALPFGSDDQLRKTVKFELESHSHNLDIEEVVVDFVKVDQKEKQTFLLAFAAPKKEMRARMDQMALAKTDPPAVDLDATGALNAILAQADASRAFVSLHVGRQTSYLYHVSGGLKLLRTLPLSSVEAEFEAKASAEVCRTLLRVSGGKELPVVYVSGDADDLPGLAASIGRDAGVESKVLDVFGDAALEFEGAEKARRAGGTALGLALKGLGVDRVGLDFRREEFTYERKSDQLKKAAAVLLALVNVFFALGAFKAWRDRDYLQSRHSEILSLEQKMYTDLFTGEQKPANPFEKFRGRIAAEKEAKGEGGHPIPRSALEYWADLFGAIKVENKFWIDTLTVSAAPGQAGINMSGRCEPASEVEKILVGVKAVPAFAGNYSPTVTQEKDRFRYDVRIPIAGAEGK